MATYRRVALLDMDSYYASIECARNPFLRKKPVAVIGTGEKTVVTSANYLAKRYGVKTGMTIPEARKACPTVVFVKADFSYYEFTTLKIAQIIERYFPVYKEASIDEFYIPLDPVCDPISRLRSLKDEIRERLGLTCTVGVGCNPIVAKAACEVSKPDGFLVVDHLEDIAEHVTVDAVPGIGSRLKTVVESLGLKTLGDFLAFAGPMPDDLILLKGLIRKEYTEGEFFRIVPPKSMGHYLTLDRVGTSFDELFEIENYLLFGIYSKLLRWKMGAKVLSVMFRHSDGTHVATSRSFGVHVTEFVSIKRVLEDLLRKLWDGRSFVKVGLTLSGLKLLGWHQPSLFWEELEERFRRLAQLENLYVGGFVTLRSKRSGEEFSPFGVRRTNSTVRT